MSVELSPHNAAATDLTELLSVRLRPRRRMVGRSRTRSPDRNPPDRNLEERMTMASAASPASARLRARRAEEREFRLLYAVSFGFFLVVVAAVRLLPRPWRPQLVGAGGDRSIIAEAKAAASIAIPFAFMG